MAVVCFYTDTDRYMGWKHFNRYSYLEVNSWLESGNKIKANGVTYTKDKMKELFNRCYDQTR